MLSIALAAGGGWYWLSGKAAVSVAAADIVDPAPAKSELAAPVKMASSRRLVLASPATCSKHCAQLACRQKK